MSGGGAEILVSAVHVTLTVGSRQSTADVNDFQFNAGKWSLEYECRNERRRLLLHRPRVGGRCPFRTLVQVKSGGRGGIVTDLSRVTLYTNECMKSNWKCIWDKLEEEILAAVPEFHLNGILKLIVVLEAGRELALAELPAASQTECSIPEGFEVPCMESLSADFGQLMVRDSNPDVVFKCAGQSIRAHGTVVCARSSVIASMLGSDMIEGRSRVVKIPNLELDIFKQFLGYIYTGKLDKLTFGTAFSLYEVGDQYAVRGLVRRCSRYLLEHLTDQNACEVLVIADAHSDGEFVEDIVDFMVDRKVPRTNDHWPSFRDEHPRLANKVLDRLCDVIPM